MSRLVSAVTSLFSGKADAPPQHHILQNGEVDREVAPAASQIAQEPQFPSGPARSTSLDISPEPPAHDSALTAAASAPSPAVSATASVPGLPPRSTAPTVFITAETATCDVAPFPLITVGPVIGLVTATTARVLIECNTSMTVQVRITQLERDVRKTRHAAAAQPAVPALQANGQSSSSSPAASAYAPAVTTQEAAIRTGASSGSPVNAAPSASSSPASTASTASASTASEPSSSPDAISQQAAILTGASSGSPVSSAVFAFTEASAQPQRSSSKPASHESPGTTIGDAASSQQEGVTSTEKRPAPATQPSPTEQPQSECQGAAQPLPDKSTFAPTLTTAREQEKQAALMHEAGGRSCSTAASPAGRASAGEVG